MNITKDMVTGVTNAMQDILTRKGNMNKMVSVAEIEEWLMNSHCNEFIPVTLTLQGLIQVKYVRYYKMDNGKLMYGFTKKAFERMIATQPTLLKVEGM